MTNFIEKVAEHIINDFKYYIDINNISQSTAANLLDISSGQLSHILKKERRLNDLVGQRMIEITKNKRPEHRGGIYGLYYKDKLIYVGKTVNFKNRWYTHKSSIKNNLQDGQPLHSSNLDVNFLKYKILFDNSKVHIFPHEINRIEAIFIGILLPEWNTDLSTTSHVKLTLNEKVLEMIKYYYTRKENTLLEIKESFLAGITSDGNKELLDSLNYNNKEIFNKIIAIIKNSKQYNNDPNLLTITINDINQMEEVMKNG